MKWVYGLLSLSLILITGITFYLINKGVSLRTAGVIKPSVIEPEVGIIGSALALRLFPDFSASDDVFWIYPDQITESEKLEIDRIIEVASKNLKDPRKISDLDLLSSESVISNQILSECPKPCWIKVSFKKLSELKPTLTAAMFIYANYFNRDMVPSADCDSSKILIAECLIPVSVREVRKKIKTADRYFFMRRYLDFDFYLLIEKTKSL